MFRDTLDRIKDGIIQMFRSRLFVLLFVFSIMSVILAGRLFYLQIIKGEDYLENYELTIRKTKEIPGTRGNIYDRNGNLLAYNELAYSVTIEDNITANTVTEKMCIRDSLKGLYEGKQKCAKKNH